jgi:dolichyl-phosphate beta-glucosyltransferase
VRFDLSVVIPAYNEALRIGPTLERVAAYLSRRGDRAEIIVVDDGSDDATIERVERVGGRAAPGLRIIKQPENRGKGAAIRRGVSETRGRRVLLCDADLSTPIEALEALERRLDDGADLAIGSRGMGDSDVRVRQPLYRELMGKTFNRIIRLLGVRGVRDTQCGFKLIEGEAARRLFALIRTEGFAFDVELIWLARRLGYRIDEVGVAWSNSKDSRVDPLADSLAMVRDVLLIRWRHRNGVSPERRTGRRGAE